MAGTTMRRYFFSSDALGAVPVLLAPAAGVAFGIFIALRGLGANDVMIKRDAQPWEKVNPDSMPRQLIVPHKDKIEAVIQQRRAEGEH